MEADNDPKAIEEAFLQSWDAAEQRCRSMSLQTWGKWAEPMLDIIKEFRTRGYDRQLQAGVMLVNFIFWRKNPLSLWDNKGQLTFKLKPEGGMKIHYWEGEMIEIEFGHWETSSESEVVEFEVEQVKITPEIEALLARLLAQPID